MSAWSIIPDHERRSIWDRFDRRFSFHPSVETFPGIREPTPSRTYFVGSAYGSSAHYFKITEGFDDACLRVCSGISTPTGRVLALDWQHECYYFNPLAHDGHWLIPPFPDGDYYIFLSESLDEGWFGHPWEQTVCIFGQRAISSIEIDPPRLLAKPIRQNTHSSTLAAQIHNRGRTRRSI